MEENHQRWRSTTVLLLLANAIIPIAIGIFASGFFPYKAFLPGRNTFTEDGLHAPPPVFDKVVFMVVDALRSDFVYSNESSFGFVQSLIRDGSAIPFTAHATSPTITMPRVKAITTGSIPSFLDVILNFAEDDTTSTLAHQDSWPMQLSAKDGGMINMFGDDTWIKLFPGLFGRADGTSSFFVSDFTEVDNNVTRNVPGELRKEDWNGMIMHYLGLDHIGHKSGPRSPHMPGKQREMDDIVQQVYTAISTEPHLRSTLLVLCGDHGMNDAGNHGGSGAGETSPALVLLSPYLRAISPGLDCPHPTPKDEFQYYQVIEQSDIAPTLAGLLGFPVPLNNLGVFITPVLDLWPNEDERLNLLQQNARQIHNIVTATFGESADQFGGDSNCDDFPEDGDELQCLWAASQLLIKTSAGYGQKSNALLKFLQRAQSVMSSTASNYDVGKLYFGVTFSGISLVLCVCALAYLSNRRFSNTAGLLSLTLFYGLMMFGSSFVEEEHHFWYWAISGWIIYLCAKNLRTAGPNPQAYGLASMLILATFRLVRRWNQTGQKFAGSPDVARTYLPEHPILLWSLVVCTVTIAGYRVASNMSMEPVASVFAVIVCVSLLGFKLAFTNADAPELLPPGASNVLDVLANIPLHTQANSVFIGLALLAGLTAFYRWNAPRMISTSTGFAEIYQALLTLLLVTQSKVINIPLFLIFQVQYWAFKSLPLEAHEITALSLMLQYCSFFALGGTNAISSIDLSSAYNGVSSYNVGMVGVLTFVGNWAGPIWWSISGIVLLLQRRDGSQRVVLRHMVEQSLFRAGGLVAVMLACTMLRTHLFIWTVFSPKYLYSMAWSLGQHLCIDLVASYLLWSSSEGLAR